MNSIQILPAGFSEHLNLQFASAIKAGMIIPVYIGANKRSAEGTKDLSPFQGFRVLGI